MHADALEAEVGSGAKGSTWRSMGRFATIWTWAVSAIGEKQLTDWAGPLGELRQLCEAASTTIAEFQAELATGGDGNPAYRAAVDAMWAELAMDEGRAAG